MKRSKHCMSCSFINCQEGPSSKVSCHCLTWHGKKATPNLCARRAILAFAPFLHTAADTDSKTDELIDSVKIASCAC